VGSDSLEYQLDDVLVRRLTHPRYVYDHLYGDDRTKKFMFAMRVLAYFRHYKLLRRTDLSRLKSGSYLRAPAVREVMALLKTRGLIKGRLDGQQWRSGRNLYKGIQA